MIRARRGALVGILNGIDADEWNPLTDRFLPSPFDADDLSGKQAAKRVCWKRLALPHARERLAGPVIGMVSRMVDQGLDLIAAVAGDLASLDATFTVVGTGEPRYQEMWRTLSRAYPDRISAFIWLRRAPRASCRGRQRHLRDAVAVRTVLA